MLPSLLMLAVSLILVMQRPGNIMVDQPGRINRDLDKKTYFDKFFPMYNRYTDDLIFNIFIKKRLRVFFPFYFIRVNQLMFVNLSFNVDNNKRKNPKMRVINNNYFK